MFIFTLFVVGLECNYLRSAFKRLMRKCNEVLRIFG